MSIQNCADVQAYIATLVDISTTAIAAQNLNNINALASITDGTFVAGENIRTTKIAYDDREGGLFIVGDNITGVTSGATFEAIGSNTGLKWIFADQVIGHSKLVNTSPTPHSLTKIMLLRVLSPNIRD